MTAGRMAGNGAYELRSSRAACVQSQPVDGSHDGPDLAAFSVLDDTATAAGRRTGVSLRGTSWIHG